jgi:hypothetical protein
MKNPIANELRDGSTGRAFTTRAMGQTPEDTIETPGNLPVLLAKCKHNTARIPSQKVANKDDG